MATKARQQYFADENSLQKQRREFSIADDIQQKIDSIEEGAQVNVIETVKVNGTPLIPDANKAVNVEVPEVIDNLYTIDSDNALSAKQGKILYDYIQNIASRGRFLSNWNSATGLPMTNPSESPYPYKSGDYFVVSNVAASGGTNYRPDGSSYIIGQASTVVETEDVSVSDFYFYDGTNWLLLSNSGRQIAIDSSLSTTSTNPVENRVITNALNGKQDTLIAGSHIDITSNVVSTTGLQEELTAGENISITPEYSMDTRGPAPDGFHVPTLTEFNGLKSIMSLLSLDTSEGWHNNLKIPYAGRRISNGTVELRYYYGFLWSSSPNTMGNSIGFRMDGNSMGRANMDRSNACSIRCLKDTYVIPDSDWTVIQGTLGGAGIFWNQTDGLISLTDGTTGYTMMDKNLGATAVWNTGDSINAANCGNYYQRGNNYGFPYSGNLTTSNSKVDAGGYGPGNYYSGSTFIIGNSDWSSVRNDNLRGGVSQGQREAGAIISATDTTYTAGTGINIDSNNVISTTITPGQTYTAGNGINIDSNNEISVDTSVVATQTDLQNGLDEKQDLLTAGDNITIEDVCTTESDMKGPAPDGFHVPLNTEWQAVKDIRVALGGGSSDGTNFGIALKLPFAGDRSHSSAYIYSQGSHGYYWSSSRSDASNAYYLLFYSTAINPQNAYLRTNGHSVRCFKNSPVVPTSSWTKLYGTSIEVGGIFWSSTDGLISLSSDGQTWATIADKNLGATTVWNSGDTLSEANCGKYYQWGNNYGFPFTGSVTTSSTQVDASNYGPGNYYSSSTFITGNSRWDSTDNGNLWGGVTQGTWQDCIHNVISSTDRAAYFKTQAEYDALPSSKNSDGNLYIIVDNHNEPVTITFTSSPEGWGTFNVNSITARQGDTITINNNVLTIGSQIITATPLSASYEFQEWAINGESLPAVVLDDMDITANFYSMS